QGMFWGVTLNILAVYFLYKALDIADLSYLMPYMTLTSLTLIVPPIIILGEVPSLLGFIGIFLVVIGAIIMEIKKKARSLDSENTAKKNRRGLMYFLVTAGCFTITPTALTLAIRESSVLFTSFLSHLLIGIGFIALIVVFRETERAKEIYSDKSARKSFFGAVILAGLSIAIANTSINAALDVQKVAYVMGVKRLMPFFAFVIGLLYFKERTNLKKKMLATALMVAGAIVITIFK
ncbi:MAG: EamA family transporter, partial [Candidatus Moranbacteria bacterium]|nr:EamA family transporter [Candidatus Moranbacteria bacterium]